VWSLFTARCLSGWLIEPGVDIYDLARRTLDKLIQNPTDKLIICTPNYSEFISELIVGCTLDLPIFLCNPDWGDREWKQVNQLLTNINWNSHRSQIMVATGGSSGRIKFAIHTWDTLIASVVGFQSFYQVEKIDSCCVLPLYHVSGLMQLMRSLVTGGKFHVSSFKQICHTPPELETNSYFISLVPTQLEKLLTLHPQWLANFKTILLGGAPPDRVLLETARSCNLPIALTYGMTETASQIVSVKPSEFLAGNYTCGRILPHAEIKLSSAGEISIRSKSLMLGYFPDVHPDLEYFHTDDLGQIDLDGYLTIIGRNSGKIITGGENVFPLEVRQAILDTKLVKDVWILGLPDRYWGEVVTALYVPQNHDISVDILKQAIASQLSKYKIPKYWIPVPEIPRNSLGKVHLDRVRELAILHQN
jgi:O-succinylbenzoic acid--CoA ligase